MSKINGSLVVVWRKGAAKDIYQHKSLNGLDLILWKSYKMTQQTEP